MKMAILMTCHNRVEKTVRCLQGLECALAECKEASYKVFLVDDGSTDGTSATVESMFGQSHVRIIQGSGRLFWAKGMRLAWEIAVEEGAWDFYLWLNDDVMLYPDAIRSVLSDCQKCQGVVVGACRESDCGSISYGATDAEDRKIIPNGTPQKADGWMNGNFVLVPRDVYQIVGMISDEYSHARADYDYAERLRAAEIPFYSSSGFVGVCHSDFESKISGKLLIQRIGLLWRPGYWNLHDLWIIRSRYHGRMRAILSCVHLMLIAVRGRG